MKNQNNNLNKDHIDHINKVALWALSAHGIAEAMTRYTDIFVNIRDSFGLTRNAEKKLFNIGMEVVKEQSMEIYLDYPPVPHPDSIKGKGDREPLEQ